MLCDICLQTQNSVHRCRRCLLRAPFFDRAIGVYEYDGPAGAAIRSAKYRYQPESIEWLCRRIQSDLPSELFENRPDVIIPVPLHWRSRIKRRLDAPLWFGHTISATLQRPLDRGVVFRNRQTLVQAGLDDPERRRNVRGAFTVVREAPKDILLVDDVFTTGATVNAVCQVLKRHGADRVRVVCAAYVDPSVGVEMT